MDGAYVESDAFKHVAAMEEHLRIVDDLLTGLTYLGETISDGGSAISTIANIARGECKSAEKLRCDLFRLTHPRRKEFDRQGWPGEAPQP